VSDQPKAVSFQAAGQPPEKVAPVQVQPEQGNETQTSKFVTVEEAQRLAKEAADQALRRAQQFFDVNQNQFGKRIQERVSQLEKAWDAMAKAGLQVPDEAGKERVRQRAIQEELTAPNSSQPPSSPSAQVEVKGQAENPEPQDPVTAEAWRMMQAAGVSIEATDPEAATLDQSSPYAFLKSVDAAINAKRERLGTQPVSGLSTSSARTPTNLGAAGKQANPIAHINDPRELYKLGFGGGS
jgi:hypothetical protein